MAMMRLDKFLSDTGTASRREAKGLLRAGRVTVDGSVCRSGEVKLDPEHSRVTVDGRPVSFAKNHYFLLNKPLGVITATEDRDQQTVLDLLPAELRRLGMRVIPGEANYLLFASPRELSAPLTERGILLRCCGNFEGLGDSWYRAAVRTHEENQRLVEALEEVLR